MDLTKSQQKVLQFLSDNINKPELGGAYYHVAEIAEAVGLSRGYVRVVTSQLVAKGIISREQLWENDPRCLEDPDPEYPALLPAWQAQGKTGDRFGNGCYYPAGNLYKLMQPASHEEERSTLEALCCVTWKTILAPDLAPVPGKNLAPVGSVGYLLQAVAA